MYVGQAQDQYSIAKAGLVTEEKERKEEIIQSSSPTTMQRMQNNSQISRSRGRWIIKFIEDLNKMQSIEERILADSVYAIITYQSMLKECVIKIVDTNEDENCSQDNLCLERTRSNTSKCLGRIRIPTFYAILGKPRSKLQMWNFHPIPSESRNWPNEELQGREVHAKDSHKDNNLSEKAAKKIHEAGNGELHKTKFKQLIADAYMRFQRMQWRGVHCHGIWRSGVQTLSHSWKLLLRDEPELRFKTPH